jgi:hypothetical protein
MKISQRIAFAAMFASTTSFISAPSYGFMVDVAQTATTASTDLTQVVDELRQELKADQTSCKEMLSKIDAAIAQVDSALDIGVADETKYLGLRDELVELRLDLPCLADELAQADAGQVVSDTLLSEQVIGEDVVGGPSGGMVGGGSSGGAGGGAGGAGGGGGLGPLAIGGLAAAIAIPAALSGDDDPGTDASPSN